jgi:hypothetical protein
MSCEGNRHQFFQWAGQKYGLKEKGLEKIYQTAKARGPQDDAEKVIQAHKTRALFGVMRSLGITPPTHSSSGLPKANSCSGYAEINDLLSTIAQSQVQKNDILADKDLRNLTDGEGYSLKTGYHKKTRRNRQGYDARGYTENNQHTWYGGRYANLVFPGSWGHAAVFAYNFGLPEDEEIDTAQRETFLAAVQDGIYPDGYDRFGFNADGYDELDLDHYGFRRGKQEDYLAAATKRIYMDVRRAKLKNPKEYEVDLEGFTENGFIPRYEDELEDKDRLGYTRKGFQQGRSWTGYDEQGVDAQGNVRPKVTWHDAWGYSRKTGLTEPDDQGRQYNLIGWQYDPKRDYCFNPKNPDQEIEHTGSWRYSGKYKKAVMARSYVPSEKELAKRLADPRLRLAEVAQGSDLYRLANLNQPHSFYDEGHAVTVAHHGLSARYLRSEMRAQKNPDAAYLGVRLRCTKCGQFTGARAHQCPSFDNQEVIQFGNGIVAARKPKVGVPSTGLDLYDDIGHGVFHIPAQEDEYNPETGRRNNASSLTSWLRKEEDTSLIVLETPYREDFDSEFEGGPIPGYSYKTGLDQEGRDLRGINPITGQNKKGDDFKTVVAIAGADQVLRDQMDDSGRDPGTAVLVETYSRIASAMAGAPRRVVLEEKGGPRDGMFSTNMKGRINAERYPLGKDAFAAENLLAMKAGVYHELGHEEDTEPAIWARVLRIAKGEEEVEGLPRGQAQMVAEVYNIIEDGRMERLQAQRRRGIASILAADAKINPRWDETVGESIPLTHQVTGMMLYRSLPFFRVRQEVFEQASPRARKLFDEIAPVVDRGTSGSGEDGLFAAIEVSRILAQDEDYKQEQQQQSQSGQGGQPQGGESGSGQSQSGNSSGQGGGGYFRISSATPGTSGQEVNDAPLPAPGQWGRQKEEETKAGSGPRAKKSEEEEKGEIGRPKKEDEDQSGASKHEKKPEDADQAKDSKGKNPDDEQAGRERSGKKAEDSQEKDKQEKQDNQDGGGGSGTGAGSGEDLEITEVTPEPDEDFFFGVSARTNLMEALGATAQEIVSGIARRKSAGANKVAAKKLREPLSKLGETLPIKKSDGRGATIYTPNNRSRIHIGRADLSKLTALDEQSQETGKRFAQRLERLRASIRQRSRHKTHGKIDRRRFKRAVAGSRSVYQQTQDKDITSLAVGISVDMSGSMNNEIESGKLFGSVSTISAAMDKMGADYMVSAFGSSTVLLKTIGDQEYPLKERGKLSTISLGGTTGAPSMAVNTIGLSQSQAANKLQFVLSDGQFNDTEDMQAEVANAQKQGILPFGVYLGNPNPRTSSSFDNVYGQGNWVSIEHLDDLPKVAAGRIERIYRRLLATR